MNKVFSLILLSLFYMGSLSAMLRYEISLEEYLSSQIPLKSIILEGEHLQAQVKMADGSDYDIVSSADWPHIREINEINFRAPEVTLTLVAKSGYKFIKKLSSFDFHIEQQFSNGRHEICLVLNSRLIFHPEDEISDEEQDNCDMESWLFPIMRTLFYGDSIHVALRVSADVANHSKPFLTFEVESSGQSLFFQLEDKGTEKIASWAIDGSLGGKGSIIQCLVRALSTINKLGISFSSIAQDRLSFLLHYTQVVADYTSPWRDWKGVGLSIFGTACYREMNPETWSVQSENRVQLQAQYDSWVFGFSSNTSYICGDSTYGQANQEIRIDNPSKNIVLLAGWIQENALEPLAEYTNTPSLIYYGTYFANYFRDALAMILLNVGELQEDGSLLLRFSRDAEGNLWIGDCQINNFGNLLINYIKQKLWSGNK